MAKPRDNVKALAKFTSAELSAEIARRENDKKWGFVIIDDSDADEEDHPRFGIVAVDEWQKNHYLGDYSLGDQVSLPPGFDEVQESTFEYRRGDVNQGKAILIQAGFQDFGVMDI